jgi:1,4-dihydroxy-2-naphthoate octaprenyltransferase
MASAFAKCIVAWLHAARFITAPTTSMGSAFAAIIKAQFHAAKFITALAATVSFTLATCPTAPF